MRNLHFLFRELYFCEKANFIPDFGTNFNYGISHCLANYFVWLNYFIPTFHFFTPWKRQKNPLVFWRFQEVKKWNIGLKWVKLYVVSVIGISCKIKHTKWYKMSEAPARGVLWKKVFLKLSKNSQENTCARVSFLIKLQASGLRLYWKRDSGTGVFLWIEISKDTFFTEHLWTTASKMWILYLSLSKLWILYLLRKKNMFSISRKNQLN